MGHRDSAATRTGHRMTEIGLLRNCANCLHWDGQGWCALTRDAKAIGGHIILPALVVCAKHEPAELDIEGPAV